MLRQGTVCQLGWGAISSRGHANVAGLVKSLRAELGWLYLALKDIFTIQPNSEYDDPNFLTLAAEVAIQMTIIS